MGEAAYTLYRKEPAESTERPYSLLAVLEDPWRVNATAKTEQITSLNATRR